eukprot:356395-Chlamydomonas_euryale.AAC.6
MARTWSLSRMSGAGTFDAKCRMPLTLEYGAAGCLGTPVLRFTPCVLLLLQLGIALARECALRHGLWICCLTIVTRVVPSRLLLACWRGCNAEGLVVASCRADKCRAPRGHTSRLPKAIPVSSRSAFMQLASRAVLLSAMVRVQAWAAGGGNAGVADMQPSLSCPAHRAQTHMQHFQHASNRTASRQINLCTTVDAHSIEGPCWSTRRSLSTCSGKRCPNAGRYLPQLSAPSQQTLRGKRVQPAEQFAASRRLYRLRLNVNNLSQARSGVARPVLGLATVLHLPIGWQHRALLRGGPPGLAGGRSQLPRRLGTARLTPAVSHLLRSAPYHPAPQIELRDHVHAALLARRPRARRAGKAVRVQLLCVLPPTAVDLSKPARPPTRPSHADLPLRPPTEATTTSASLSSTTRHATNGARRARYRRVIGSAKTEGRAEAGAAVLRG